MQDDDEATDEEGREAEALARALDGGGEPGAATPTDALAVSALLRHGLGAGDLDPARAQAISARVRKGVVPGRRWGRWWLWIAPPVAALVTAGVLLVPLRRSPLAPGSAPLPSGALLAAQAAAARGGGEGLAALDRQMREYRRAIFQQMTGTAGAQ